MPRIPPPLPEEDELDQDDRREEQRFAAPVLFGPLLGIVVGALLLMTLLAFGVKINDWLRSAILYAFMLVLGPFAIYRLSKARPDWVETGLVDDPNEEPRPPA
jgi:hypothetical protein